MNSAHIAMPDAPVERHPVDFSEKQIILFVYPGVQDRAAAQ